MRLYLSGGILSAPSLRIHSGGLVSATTRCSILSTGPSQGCPRANNVLGGGQRWIGPLYSTGLPLHKTVSPEQCVRGWKSRPGSSSRSAGRAEGQGLPWSPTPKGWVKVPGGQLSPICALEMCFLRPGQRPAPLPFYCR